jgi:hypothetical protein
LLDFNGSNGALYLAAIDNVGPTSQPDRMYTVDTTTGAAMLVGDISADPAGAELSAFAIAEPAGAARTRTSRGSARRRQAIRMRPARRHR